MTGVPTNVLMKLLLELDERLVCVRRKGNVAENSTHDERADLLRLRSWSALSSPCTTMQKKLLDVQPLSSSDARRGEVNYYLRLCDHLYGRGQSDKLVLGLVRAMCNKGPQR
jgi:hypothetical protein